MAKDNHQSKIADFWTKKSGEYDDKEGRWYLHYEYNRRNQLAYIAVNKHINKQSNSNKTSIVDFGCGNGSNLQRFSKIFSKCYGVDIANEMVASARKRAPACIIEQTRLEDFNHKVNVITAIGLVEYLENPELLFVKSSTILFQDGLLVFSFNKSESLLAKIESWYRLKKKRYFPNKSHSLNRQYSQKEINKYCDQNNLLVLEEVNYGFRSNLFTLGWARFLYPVIEILLDILLPFNVLRSLISTNTLVVCTKNSSKRSD